MPKMEVKMAKRPEVKRKYEQDVADRMTTLRGQSRKDLEADQTRGASSPLGGRVTEREAERRRRK